MNEALLREAWQMMETITPLSFDCGLRCGAACCRTDGDGQGGVYLFPGEAALMQGAEWGEIVPTDFAPMLVCHAPCDRARRPLLCRFFPLLPFRDHEGRWRARLDARARAVCPLTRAGVRGLQPEFVRQVCETAARLGEDADSLDLMRRWWQAERTFRREIEEWLG